MHGNYVIGVHKYLATAYHTNGEIKLCQKCDTFATSANYNQAKKLRLKR